MFRKVDTSNMPDSQLIAGWIREALDQGRYALVAELGELAHRATRLTAEETRQANRRAAGEAMWPKDGPDPMRVPGGGLIHRAAPGALWEQDRPRLLDPDQVDVSRTAVDEIAANIRTAMDAEQVRQQLLHPFGELTLVPRVGATRDELPARPDDTAVMPPVPTGSHAPRQCYALVGAIGGVMWCVQPIQYDPINRVWLHVDPEITDHDAAPDPVH